MPINRSPNHRSVSMSTIDDLNLPGSSAVTVSTAKRGRPPKDDKDKKEKEKLDAVNNQTIITQLSSLIDKKNLSLKQQIIEQQKDILADNCNQIRIEQKRLKALIDEKLNAQSEKYTQLRDEMIILINDKLNNKNNKNGELKKELHELIDSKMSLLNVHINEITSSLNNRMDTCNNNIKLNFTKLQDITTKINKLDDASSQQIATIDDELNNRINCMSNIILTGIPEAARNNLSPENYKVHDDDMLNDLIKVVSSINPECGKLTYLFNRLGVHNSNNRNALNTNSNNPSTNLYKNLAVKPSILKIYFNNIINCELFKQTFYLALK